MSQIFRLHLPHSQAHIVAGLLASGSIPAAVVGDLAASLYGGTLMIDCAVIVPEEYWEEAEAFLAADFADEPLDVNQPAETCPPDGDPPGIRDILCATLYLAPIGFGVRVLLVTLAILQDHAGSLGYLQVSMRPLFIVELPLLVGALIIHAIGAGLMLRVIKGYRRGSRPCRVIVKGLLILLLI